MRGALLGLLLGAAARGWKGTCADHDDGLEALVVVGSGFGHRIAGRTQLAQGAELLEAGLPVQARTETVGGLDQRIEQGVDEGVGGVTSGRQVQRPQDGFEGVGQDRGLAWNRR